MKFFALFISIFALTQTIQALDEKHFDGFYTGIDVGYTYNDSIVSDFDISTPINQLPGDRTHTFFTFNEKDIFYSGSLGYRKQFNNNLILGLEASIEDTNLRVTDFSWMTATTIGYAFGKQKQHSIFSQAGYSWARYYSGGFTLREGVSPEEIDIANPLNSLDKLVEGKITTSAVYLAVGYECAFTDRFNIRLKASRFGDRDLNASFGVIVKF